MNISNCTVVTVLGNGEYEFSYEGDSVIRKDNLDNLLSSGNNQYCSSLDELDDLMKQVPEFHCNLSVGDKFYLDKVQLESSEIVA